MGNRLFIATYKLIKQYIERDVSVLEIGCRDDRVSLSSYIFEAKLTGLDRDPLRVDIARELSKPGTDFINCDLLNYSGKKFDIVISTAIAHHTSRDEIFRLFSKLADIAKNRIILSGPNAEVQTEIYGDHRYHLDLGDLCCIADCLGFKLVAHHEHDDFEPAVSFFPPEIALARAKNGQITLIFERLNILDVIEDFVPISSELAYVTAGRSYTSLSGIYRIKYNVVDGVVNFDKSSAKLIKSGIYLRLGNVSDGRFLTFSNCIPRPEADSEPSSYGQPNDTEKFKPFGIFTLDLITGNLEQHKEVRSIYAHQPFYDASTGYLYYTDNAPNGRIFINNSVSPLFGLNEGYAEITNPFICNGFMYFEARKTENSAPQGWELWARSLDSGKCVFLDMGANPSLLGQDLFYGRWNNKNNCFDIVHRKVSLRNDIIQSKIDSLKYPPTHDYIFSNLTPSGVLLDRLNNINKFYPKFFSGADSFLDVGCNKGFFLLYGRDFFANITGFEVEKEYYDLCKNFESANVSIYSYGLKDSPVPKQFYDRIFLGNVWHYCFAESRYSYDFVLKLSLIVRSEGLVLFEGPISSEDPDIQNMRSLGISGDKVNHVDMKDFSYENLKDAMIEHKFEPLGVYPSVNYTPQRRLFCFKRL